MSGIILLLVAALWLVILFVLVKLLGRLLPKVWWAHALRIAVFLALLPLPLADEIAGARQFEKLCKENSTINMDRTKAAGKTVYLSEVADVEIKGMWVPIWKQSWRFVDATTGEMVVSYAILRASGGMLMPASLGPLTFNGNCAPANRPASVETFKQFGIRYIEPPVKK